MEISVAVQSMSFLYAFLFGAVTGLLYDIFRILRIAFPIGKVAVFIEDVLYLLSAGLLTFVYLLKFNSGEIRSYILLGTLLGFIVYYFTVGKLIIGSAKLIIKLIKIVLSFLFGILLIPIKKICSFLMFIFKKIAKILKKSLKKLLNLFHFMKKKYMIYLYNLRKKKKEKSGDKSGSRKKKQNHSNGNVLRNSGHFDHFNDGFR